MSWNTSSPVGSDQIANGDNEIRTLKTDLQTALRGNATDGDEAKFPGSDVANPIYRYRGLKGTTAARPTAGQYGLYFNTTLNQLQRDNGSSWENIGTMFPATTGLVFYQATPPTGWTAVSQNDKALRVVSSGGTGGSAGGTTAFSSCWAATSTGSESSHTHLVSGTSGTASGGSISVTGPGAPAVDNSHTHSISITSAAGSSHSHTVTAYAPQYIDVVVATKD